MASEIPDYIGAIGGLIGAIGGIAGTWISIVSLRRTNQHKKLDLRVQLRKDEATILKDVEALGPLMVNALKSKMAMLSSRGALQSSVRNVWEGQYQRDLEEVNALSADVKEIGGDVSHLTDGQLEHRTVRAHELKRRVDDMTAKYEGSLADDDRMRDRLSHTATGKP